MLRWLIPHIDDVGVTVGSVVALEELSGAGIVTCGSAMVPAPAFNEVVELAARRLDLDLGIHLTLTSESDSVKWGPVGDVGPNSGLVDEDGHFWKTVQEVRERADPVAVGRELAAQVQKALDSGIAVSHLDHHMGTALNPEFAEITIGLGEEFGIPVLFPRQIGDYFDLLGKGPVDVAYMESLRNRLEAHKGLFIDRFAMGLGMAGPTEQVYKKLISEAGPGVTFLALHCNAPGDIEQVHPRDYRRRIEEYELFGDPRFAAWVTTQKSLRLAGFRKPDG